jgi:aspartate aminotransferase
VATSLLYGTSPQQRESALAAGQPETLPWIAHALNRLGDALRQTTCR